MAKKESQEGRDRRQTAIFDTPKGLYLRQTVLATLLMVPLALGSVAPAVADEGPDLPNREVTPGVADPNATVNDNGPRDICHTKTGTVRAGLHAETKREAFERYGLIGNCTGFCSGPEGCEIDHLISLELGGTNDVANLWPQQYDGKVWNAHVKDILENRLHKLVCEEALPLPDAQEAISINWIAAYKKYVGPAPPSSVSHGVARCDR